jgi:hypothetical protein
MIINFMHIIIIITKQTFLGLGYFFLNRFGGCHAQLNINHFWFKEDNVVRQTTEDDVDAKRHKNEQHTFYGFFCC